MILLDCLIIKDDNIRNIVYFFDSKKIVFDQLWFRICLGITFHNNITVSKLILIPPKLYCFARFAKKQFSLVESTNYA